MGNTAGMKQIFLRVLHFPVDSFFKGKSNFLE